MVSTLLKSPITSLPFNKIPSLAPLPILATLDTGTPITSAPGQPSTKIVTAVARAFGSLNAKCIIKPTNTPSIKTSGVYQVENLSINLSASDLESCASSTNSIILPKVVSSPTFSASILKVPSSKIVPANTLSLTPFSRGIDSPVILASFKLPSPLIITPSTGTLAPVLTNKISPSLTSSISTSKNLPSSISLTAVSGAINVNSLIADLVLFKVLASK